MHPFAILSALALACSVLAKPTEFQRHAGNVDVRGVPIRHSHRSRSHQTRGERTPNNDGKLKKRQSNGKKKRCVAKTTTTSAAVSASTTASQSASKTKSASPAATTTPSSDSGNNSGSNSGSSNSTSGSSPGGHPPNSGAVVHINDPTCGANNPTAKPGNGVGPNGSQDWMNCGLKSGNGWTPPLLKMSDVVYVNLADAMKMENNQFGGCEQYLSIFQAAAKKYSLPDILLASIAMQESSCQPQAFSAGSHGLFQLSDDLCKPYGDCFDPKSNTDGGAKYLRGLLDSNQDNILVALGQYNGWYQGIQPASVQDQPCATRQNWNYQQNTLNGWMQGLDGYSNGNVHDGCDGADAA